MLPDIEKQKWPGSHKRNEIWILIPFPHLRNIWGDKRLTQTVFDLVQTTLFCIIFWIYFTLIVKLRVQTFMYELEAWQYRPQSCFALVLVVRFEYLLEIHKPDLATMSFNSELLSPPSWYFILDNIFFITLDNIFFKSPSIPGFRLTHWSQVNYRYKETKC